MSLEWVTAHLRSRSGRSACQVGYEFDRQRGSHMVLRNSKSPHRRMVVPDHKELAKGTLRSIIREAGLTVDEFVALL